MLYDKQYVRSKHKKNITASGGEKVIEGVNKRHANVNDEWQHKNKKKSLGKKEEVIQKSKRNKIIPSEIRVSVWPIQWLQLNIYLKNLEKSIG